MPVEFTCPHCGKFSQVADEFVGQTGPCASCGNTISIPLPKNHGPTVSKSSHGSGTVIVICLSIAGIGILGCGGLLVALLLPAVSTARVAARRAQCSNNLKMIGLAMHNYHDVYKSFPPAFTVNEEGERLHSWRSLLLPFMGQQALYSSINFDEPWNSPDNLIVSQSSFALFQCPQDPSGTVSYMTVVGEGSAFEGEVPVSLHEFRDGTSNTILVVEVQGQTGNWMEPVDLDLDQMQMRINGGSIETSSAHSDGVNVLMADGAVRFLNNNLPPNTLRSMISKSGHEPIQ